MQVTHTKLCSMSLAATPCCLVPTPSSRDMCLFSTPRPAWHVRWTTMRHVHCRNRQSASISYQGCLFLTREPMTKHLSPGHRLFRCSLTPRLAGPASTKLLRLLVCDSQEAGKSLSHSPHGKPPGTQPTPTRHLLCAHTACALYEGCRCPASCHPSSQL